jgi:hypothetical protein
MSKNNFKKEIQNRYKGRGNSWVKVPFDSKAYGYIEKLYEKIDSSITNSFINHNKREGFSWMRFKKVEGDKNDPFTVFEVRVKGSKIDQPEHEIKIPDSIVSTLELLGNTPLKLQLETESKTIVKKKSERIITSKENNEELSDDVYIKQKVNVIKEAALTKPKDKELQEWYRFLKLNDLYEESAWQ